MKWQKATQLFTNKKYGYNLKEPLSDGKRKVKIANDEIKTHGINMFMT